MEVIDMQKLETAILYIQRITEGKNPVNNMPAEDDSIINNPNVIRCMYFVKEVLDEVKRNEGIIGNKKSSKKKESKQEFPLEKLKEFAYKEDKAATQLVEQLNELIDSNIFRKLTYKQVTGWLISEGYLKEEEKPEGKRKIPTDKGSKIGINKELRHKADGSIYTYITYNQTAQEFIVSNMGEILKND